MNGRYPRGREYLPDSPGSSSPKRKRFADLRFGITGNGEEEKSLPLRGRWLRRKPETEGVSVPACRCASSVRCFHQLRSGMVHVNDQSIGDEAHVMFGGEKASGVGRFNGDWVLRKFTTEQWIAASSE